MDYLLGNSDLSQRIKLNQLLKPIDILIKELLNVFSEVILLKVLTVDLELDHEMVNNLKVNREEISNFVNLLEQSQNPFQSLLIRLIEIASGIII